MPSILRSQFRLNFCRFISLILFINSHLWLQGQAAPLKIAIDAGHGGRDSGATHGSLIESRLVMGIADKLRERMSQNPAFITYMTRKSDEFLSIMDRTALVEGASADLMISIHANSSPDKNARGTEIYLRNVLPPGEDSLYLANRENQFAGKTTSASNTRNWLSSQEDIKTIVQDLKRQQSLRHSARLAEHIMKNWSRRSKRDRSSVRQAPFFVISNVDIPSVLIEIGYVTNAYDRQWLERPSTVDEIVDSLYSSLISYTAELTSPVTIR